jgi:hypothetical protein
MTLIALHSQVQGLPASNHNNPQERFQILATRMHCIVISKKEKKTDTNILQLSISQSLYPYLKTSLLPLFPFSQLNETIFNSVIV